MSILNFHKLIIFLLYILHNIFPYQFIVFIKNVYHPCKINFYLNLKVLKQQKIQPGISTKLNFYPHNQINFQILQIYFLYPSICKSYSKPPTNNYSNICKHTFGLLLCDIFNNDNIKNTTYRCFMLQSLKKWLTNKHYMYIIICRMFFNLN